MTPWWLWLMKGEQKDPKVHIQSEASTARAQVTFPPCKASREWLCVDWSHSQEHAEGGCPLLTSERCLLLPLVPAQAGRWNNQIYTEFQNDHTQWVEVSLRPSPWELHINEQKSCFNRWTVSWRSHASCRLLDSTIILPLCRPSGNLET